MSIMPIGRDVGIRIVTKPGTLRCTIVLVALILLFIRIGHTFRHPELWGEDVDFYYEPATHGLRVFGRLIAGYFLFMQSAIGYFASFFNPVYVAAIFCYSAIAVTGLTVWIVTSPRLVLPYKSIVALAVVLVPMGHEELGNTANTQWIMPIGAFAFLLMRPAQSRMIWFGEALFIAVMSLSGPFSIFLAPLFWIFWYFAAPGRDRLRLLLLGTTCSLGAIVQLVAVLLNGGQNVPIHQAYDWTLWLDLPFSRIASDFGPVSSLFVGRTGFVLALVCSALAIVAALKPPYRLTKLSIIYFSAAIAFGGLFKFRDAIATQAYATRYFYVGSIFVFWFIAFVLHNRKWRIPTYVVLTGAMLFMIPAVINTPTSDDDLHWPYWAAHVTSGVPVIIPATPAGFYVDLPANPQGPLAPFAAALGRPITSLHLADRSFCEGSLDTVSVLPDIHFASTGLDILPSRVWLASGIVFGAGQGRAPDLVAITDAQGTVVGFGFPDFPATLHAIDGGDNDREWRSIFTSPGGLDLQAYAIDKKLGALCRLAGSPHLHSAEGMVATPKFVGAAAILPGSEIVQELSVAPTVQSLSVALVTWGHDPSRYTVNWRLEARAPDTPFQEVGAGVIDASEISDWQKVPLQFSNPRPASASDMRLTLTTDTNERPAFPLGVPLFRSSDPEPDPPASINGSQADQGAQVELTRIF